MAHAISRAAPYYKAPLELRERIQVSLRETIGATTSRGAAVGEQVSAETARYCASEITGTFHVNLFAEEIDVRKKVTLL
jgi:hypothetical protein